MGDVVPLFCAPVEQAEEHAFDCFLVDVPMEARQAFRDCFDQASELAPAIAKRHGLDYDDAVIAHVSGLLSEAFFAADNGSKDAAGVLEFIGDLAGSLLDKVDADRP